MQKRKLFNTTVIFGLSLFLVLGLAVKSSKAEQGEEYDSRYIDEVHLIIGELVKVQVHSLTRVSLTDPSVADITGADDQEVELIGQTVGQTALFIWDDYGKRAVMVYVRNQNLDFVKTRLKKLFKAADIHGLNMAINEREGKIVITGEIPDDKRDHYDTITSKFDIDILDFVEDEVIEDLVQIDLQFTELTTTLRKQLGIDWTTGGTSGIAPVYTEDVPNMDGSISDFFQIGAFTRSGQLAAAVNALITEGKGRILSKPKLVVISGEQADFLVGGEIPIRTTTFSDSGSSQENISFREYGISMAVTPTIRKDKIDIIMSLEVSEIDASTASTISDDIAFSTRSASTHLLLDNGQTIVFAGLIRKASSETLTKVPFLGDIPILGLLFRSTANPIPENDQELVITLTPHIMRQKDTLTVQKPLQEERGAIQSSGTKRRRKSYNNTSPYYFGIPKEMMGYVHDVQQKISQAIVYPSEARQYGWEGTVKMGVLILNDGTLAFALIKKSSGYDIFDEMALETTRQLAPFSAFPSNTDLQELNVTIPIMYSLKNK